MAFVNPHSLLGGKVQMTADERIQYIEKQIAACELDRTNAINCPYCDSQNIEGNPLCCNTFARAVAAILLRKDLHDKSREAERIIEKVQTN